MISSSPLAWRPSEARHPVHDLLRRIAARKLHSASAMLARLASHLAAPEAAPEAAAAAGSAWPAPHLEFHAEAGAPEGALYLDGHLVGWVRGVTRL